MATAPPSDYHPQNQPLLLIHLGQLGNKFETTWRQLEDNFETTPSDHYPPNQPLHFLLSICHCVPTNFDFTLIFSKCNYPSFFISWAGWKTNRPCFSFPLFCFSFQTDFLLALNIQVTKFRVAFVPQSKCIHSLCHVTSPNWE